MHQGAIDVLGPVTDPAPCTKPSSPWARLGPDRASPPRGLAEFDAATGRRLPSRPSATGSRCSSTPRSIRLPQRVDRQGHRATPPMAAVLTAASTSPRATRAIACPAPRSKTRPCALAPTGMRPAKKKARRSSGKYGAWPKPTWSGGLWGNRFIADRFIAGYPASDIRRRPPARRAAASEKPGRSAPGQSLSCWI